VAINLDPAEKALSIPIAGQRYTLSAPQLSSPTLLLNGTVVNIADDGTVPPISGQSVEAGLQRFAPRTITFITFKRANNTNCK
jgi:heparanase 1